VNDHVTTAAEELRRRGHEVVVLAPSTRARDLAAGRRALRRLERDGTPLDGVVALGPAVRVSRRSRLGLPVGVRTNLEEALVLDRFDVVHAHEPGVPSLSYLALRRARGFAVATYHSPERLAYPPGKRQREKLLARVDALTAVGERALEAARERFPGDYRSLPFGVDLELFRPAEPLPRFVLEWSPDEIARTRAALRALRDLPDWELVFLRTRPLSGRPYVPIALAGRVTTARALDAAARARELAGTAGLIPAARGSERLRVEAEACGVPIVDPPGATKQPALIGAALGRLADDVGWRRSEGEAARARAERESAPALADALEEIYGEVVARRRSPRATPDDRERPRILVDLHLHTEHSYDCAVPVSALLGHAQAIGLGAIAITDHNAFGGAREALALARGGGITVIPGEEVKTTQGEVIGLFLEDEIRAGMSMEETIEAIREQGGLVYLPHPFDRLHAIPDARTLRRNVADIDVLEVYNARLLRDGFNDEALRFAQKYNLTPGAGSDAHVLQGVGTGLVRMRAFDSAEEFLLNLRGAEIVRRPKSLVYLQSLKWVAQARERRGKLAVR
jgi:predicted metal-dependent phosphoesterase TrpH/glycosyltransferase involved in cell wall biosynthesis